MAKISIIVPVYNAEAYIKDCVISILAQSFIDFELILVDDGSKDDSLPLCISLSKTDSRIKVVAKDNGGVSSARNQGLSVATGEFVTFIDSDDFVDQNYCSSLLNFMTDEVGMVVLGVQKYNPDGKTSPITHRLNSGLYSFEDFSKIVIDDGGMSGFTLHSSCAVLFKTELIRRANVRFNENIKFNEDGLFCCEYFLTSNQSVYVDYANCVYYYRTNFSSATKSADLDNFAYRQMMEEIQLVLSKYIEILPNAKIKEQLLTRSVAKAVEIMIHLAQRKELSANKTKSLLKNRDVHQGIKLINKKILNRKKKLLLFAMRLHAYRIISKLLSKVY